MTPWLGVGVTAKGIMGWIPATPGHFWLSWREPGGCWKAPGASSHPFHNLLPVLGSTHTALWSASPWVGPATRSSTFSSTGRAAARSHLLPSPAAPKGDGYLWGSWLWQEQCWELPCSPPSGQTWSPCWEVTTTMTAANPVGTTPSAGSPSL